MWKRHFGVKKCKYYTSHQRRLIGISCYNIAIILAILTDQDDGIQNNDVLLLLLLIEVVGHRL